MTKDDLTLRVPNGTALYPQDLDDNFRRLMYFSGDWQAGSYEANELVVYNSIAWVCVSDTTDEPTIASSNWKPISRSPTALCELHQDLSVGGIDVGVSYVSVDWMDLEAYSPLNIQSDLVDNFLIFEQDGVYDLSFAMIFEHDESQQGRQSNVRIFNATDSVGGVDYPFWVARNQAGSNVVVNMQVQVNASDLGKQFRMQWGNGSSFGSILYRFTQWSMNKIA